MALEYAQRYLHEFQGHVKVTLVKMREGRETDAFLKALE